MQLVIQILHSPPSLLSKQYVPQTFFASPEQPQKHGCKHEAMVIAEYEKTIRKPVVTKCGTIVNMKYSFLDATPDFLCECGEVKCPYCIEGVDFDTMHNRNHSTWEKLKDAAFSKGIMIIISKPSS